MIRRIATLTVLLAAGVLLLAGGAPAAGAGTPNDEMRQSILVLRGLIDRAGAARAFSFPLPARVQPGHLGGSQWPRDPWTGALLTPGDGRGHYRYTVTSSRRTYELVGHLDGGAFVVRGGMPRTVRLAYDHRGEEGLNLIRQYVEQWSRSHAGRYPLPVDVADDGAVGRQPGCSYWPSNPWDHANMAQRADRGSFSYAVTADLSAYTLRLHRSLKHDYVLRGTAATDPWRQLLASLEDEILRRSGRILAGYVDRWSLEHGGALPRADDLTAGGAVGAVHPDWPQDPIAGGALRPGSAPGGFTYVPGATGDYRLTIHLHSGDFEAGGLAPAPPAHGSGPSTP